MPVSEEREAQIRELSNGERVDRLDTSAFTEADWKGLDAALDEETLAFCRETADPEELHAFAATWNWDQGTWALSEIIRNPACEAATALLIYWRAMPEWLLQFADRQAVAADPLGASLAETFDFLAEIEALYLAGGFRVGSLSYDPAAEGLVGVYDDMRDSFVRALPEAMYAPVSGIPS